MLLNLNNLAGGVLASAGVQPYEPCHWFKCTGQQNNQGIVAAFYAQPIRLDAKVQSVKDDEQTKSDDVTQRPIVRAFYLGSTAQSSVSGLARAEECGADYLYFKGAWWLITAVPEDFTNVGWVRVIATQQVTGPSGVEPPPSV